MTHTLDVVVSDGQIIRMRYDGHLDIPHNVMAAYRQMYTAAGEPRSIAVTVTWWN